MRILLLTIDTALDSHFRAFDSRTGKELWATKPSEIARAVNRS